MPNDIDSAINNETNIQTAAWTATNPNLPLSTCNLLPKHIRIKIAEKRRVRASYQCTFLPSHKQNYSRLVNSLKKLITKYKDTAFINNITNFTL